MSTALDMKAAAIALRKNGWLIRQGSGAGIEAFKVIDKKKRKVIDTRLVKVKDGYAIQFPDYSFVNRNSILAPRYENERRFCRQQSVIRSIVFALKNAGVWDQVVNKDFVMVNRYNESIDKRFHGGRLKKLLA